jgi:hypothetical protein
MSSYVPTSLYVLLNIFSKSFIKKNASVKRHDGINVKMVEVRKRENFLTNCDTMAATLSVMA